MSSSRLRIVCALFLLLPAFATSQTQDAPPIPSTIEGVRELIGKGKYVEASDLARKLLEQVERSQPGSLPHADILDAIVECTCRGGKVKEAGTALQLAQQAIRIRVQTSGEDDPSVSTSLRGLGNVYMVQRDPGKAVEAFERALRIRERVYGPEAPETAEILSNLAAAHSWMAEHLRAKAEWERALSIVDKAGGVDPRTIPILNNLGNVCSELGRYEEALDYYTRSLSLTETLKGRDHPDVSIVLFNLGLTHRELGHLDLARSELQSVLSIREKTFGQGSERTIAVVSALGSVEADAGNLISARRHHEKAVRLAESAFGPDHLQTAVSRGNLANDLAGLGDDRSALPLYEKALKFFESQPKGSAKHLAQTLGAIADISRRQGDLAGARAFNERAMEALRQDLGPGSYLMAYHLGNLASYDLQEGKLNASQARYEEVLTILHKAYGPRHPQVAQTLGYLGHLAYLQGELDKAAPLLEEALSQRTALLGKDNPLVAASLIDRSRLRWTRGEPVAAIEDALQAEGILHRYVRAVAGSLSHREALQFESIRQSGVDMALTILLSGQASGSSPAQVERVWNAILRSRALVMDITASRRSAGAEDEELASARNRLAAIVVRGPDPNQPDVYRDRYERAREEVDRLERDLAQKGGPSAAQRSGLDLAAARAALGGESALVAFIEFERLIDPRHKERSYAALVLPPGKGSPQAALLGTKGRIDALIQGWRTACTRQPSPLAADPSAAEGACRAEGSPLEQAIWQPVRADFGKPQTVFVVPDGAINLVSLGTLPAGAERYVAEERYLLHYLSAERDLLRPASRAHASGALLIGGPDFDDAPATVFAEGAAPLRSLERSSVPQCDSFEGLQFVPLPWARTEIEDLDAILKDEPRRTLIGPEATEAAFKEAAAGRRLIHLATHGFFLNRQCGTAPDSSTESRYAVVDDAMLLAGLALAGANRRKDPSAGGEDGVLMALEIASLDLSSVDWAVLSACETGLGPIQSGEGVLGLRRAFQVAGARTVIMSLWKVEDESTHEWMHALHAARARGASTVQSVRDANLAVLNHLRKTRRSAHPFHWGAFVAAGDWR